MLQCTAQLHIYVCAYLGGYMAHHTILTNTCDCPTHAHARTHTHTHHACYTPPQPGRTPSSRMQCTLSVQSSCSSMLQCTSVSSWLVHRQPRVCVCVCVCDVAVLACSSLYVHCVGMFPPLCHNMYRRHAMASLTSQLRSIP